MNEARNIQPPRDPAVERMPIPYVFGARDAAPVAKSVAALFPSWGVTPRYCPLDVSKLAINVTPMRSLYIAHMCRLTRSLANNVLGRSRGTEPRPDCLLGRCPKMAPSGAVVLGSRFSFRLMLRGSRLGSTLGALLGIGDRCSSAAARRSRRQSASLLVRAA